MNYDMSLVERDGK
jgi:hypothetical protein